MFARLLQYYPNMHISQAVVIGARFCHGVRKLTDIFREDNTAQTPLRVVKPSKLLVYKPLSSLNGECWILCSKSSGV